MTRRRLFLACSLSAMVARAGNKKKRSDNDRKRDELRDLAARLRKLRNRSPVLAQQQPLYTYTDGLLEEAESAPAGSYLLGRLLKAADSLLDAGYELDAVKGQKPDKDDNRDRTARDLTDSYFRVKQGDYYASQARQRWARALPPMAQHFYQLARREYDRGANTLARRYAEAARELISALEALAQAAVRVPEPPKM